jgi:hypothetical protein
MSVETNGTVRHMCPYSSIPFNTCIYIYDSVKMAGEKWQNFIFNNVKLNCLIFADDQAITAKSKCRSENMIFLCQITRLQ